MTKTTASLLNSHCYYTADYQDISYNLTIITQVSHKKTANRAYTSLYSIVFELNDK